MKKIALTQRLILNEECNETREALDIRYCKLLKDCGYLPIVLPYEVNYTDYFENFEIEGLLLTGGNDLSTYNFNNLSKIRDDYETKILEYCIKKNIPILGICRGMQLIADYFGSNFIKCEGEIEKKQKLISMSNSKYHKYISKIESVNSYHNFAIDNLSNNLIISAVNENGIIKAIEHKKYNIFGQMWHSEREEEFSNKELELIKAIL